MDEEIHGLRITFGNDAYYGRPASHQPTSSQRSSSPGGDLRNQIRNRVQLREEAKITSSAASGHSMYSQTDVTQGDRNLFDERRLGHSPERPFLDAKRDERVSESEDFNNNHNFAPDIVREGDGKSEHYHHLKEENQFYTNLERIYRYDHKDIKPEFHDNQADITPEMSPLGVRRLYDPDIHRKTPDRQLSPVSFNKSTDSVNQTSNRKHLYSPIRFEESNLPVDSMKLSDRSHSPILCGTSTTPSEVRRSPWQEHPSPSYYEYNKSPDIQHRRPPEERRYSPLRFEEIRRSAGNRRASPEQFHSPVHVDERASSETRRSPQRRQHPSTYSASGRPPDSARRSPVTLRESPHDTRHRRAPRRASPYREKQASSRRSDSGSRKARSRSRSQNRYREESSRRYKGKEIPGDRSSRTYYLSDEDNTFNERSQAPSQSRRSTSSDNKRCKSRTDTLKQHRQTPSKRGTVKIKGTTIPPGEYDTKALKNVLKAVGFDFEKSAKESDSTDYFEDLLTPGLTKEIQKATGSADLLTLQESKPLACQSVSIKQIAKPQRLPTTTLLHSASSNVSLAASTGSNIHLNPKSDLPKVLPLVSPLLANKIFQQNPPVSILTDISVPPPPLQSGLLYQQQASQYLAPPAQAYTANQSSLYNYQSQVTSQVFPLTSLPPPPLYPTHIPPPNFYINSSPSDFTNQTSRPNLKVISTAPAEKSIGQKQTNRSRPLTKSDKFIEEKKTKRLDSLEAELEKLKKRQIEMALRKKRQQNPNEHEMKMRTSLLKKQIREIRNSTEETPKAQNCMDVKKNSGADDIDQEINYIDPESHFCKECYTTSNNLQDFLDHLRSKSHVKAMDPHNKPWSQKSTVKKKKSKNMVSIPYKGTEFLYPIVGFYCDLCKSYCGDDLAVEDHCKSEDHNDNYNNFCLDNPEYEKQHEEVSEGVRTMKEERPKKKQHSHAESVNSQESRSSNDWRTNSSSECRQETPPGLPDHEKKSTNDKVSLTAQEQFVQTKPSQSHQLPSPRTCNNTTKREVSRKRRGKRHFAGMTLDRFTTKRSKKDETSNSTKYGDVNHEKSDENSEQSLMVNTPMMTSSGEDSYNNKISDKNPEKYKAEAVELSQNLDQKSKVVIKLSENSLSTTNQNPPLKTLVEQGADGRITRSKSAELGKADDIQSHGKVVKSKHKNTTPKISENTGMKKSNKKSSVTKQTVPINAVLTRRSMRKHHSNKKTNAAESYPKQSSLTAINPSSPNVNDRETMPSSGKDFISTNTVDEPPPPGTEDVICG